MSGERVIARLAELIETVSGNVVPPDHYRFLAHAAEERAQARGFRSLDAYVGALGTGTIPEEWRSLLPHVTVKESFLFRTPQHFDAIADTVLPELLRHRAGSRRLRCWSAGCARGEEPVTLAVVLAEQPALAGWDWRIVATDVDEEALAFARAARFAGRAVGKVPPALLDRYFRPHGDEFELIAPLRERIEWVASNLMALPLSVPHGPFDLVLLRNVLIYFAPESQRRVVAAVAGLLARDGALFLGPAETLWQLETDLAPVRAGGCFFYRRTSPSPRNTTHSPATAPVHPVRAETPRLRPSSSPPAVPAPRPTVTKSSREELAEAARRLAGGDLESASRSVERILVADPADALGHTLEGFVHDVSGRSQMAVASYRAALFLRPELLPVRFLLAEALRRLGWKDRARQEYRRVLATASDAPVPDLEVLSALPLPDREWIVRTARDRLVDS